MTQALKVSTDDRARRDAIDELLAKAAPAVIRDKATLEDMLAEGKSVRKRGMEFLFVPPTIKQLAVIGQIYEAIQSATDSEELNRLWFKIAEELIWIPGDEALRPANRDDLEGHWSAKPLMDAITETLNRNGFETEPKNA